MSGLFQGLHIGRWLLAALIGVVVVVSTAGLEGIALAQEEDETSSGASGAGDEAESLPRVELVPIALVPQSRSFDQCRAAAESGDVKAMLELAWRYENGNGTKKDESAGAQWLIKAADAGDLDALVYLAARLAHGVGVKLDPQRSQRLYARAAEAGHPQAQYELGRAAVASDEPKQAFTWFAKAADQGHGAAMVERALCYLEGRGADTDAKAAVELLTAADQRGVIAAARHLGRLYMEGNGVEPDGRAAVKWLNKAANAGDLEAAWSLAMVYDQGQQGIPKDPVKSLLWVRKLVERKHHDAQVHLAKTNPEALKAAAKRATKKQLTVDRYIGGIVEIEARLQEIRDGQWLLAMPGEQFVVHGDPTNLQGPGAEAGTYLTIYGILGIGEAIEVLVVERVQPSLEWSYELQTPKGGIRAGAQQEFVVVGVVKNTGKQPSKRATTAVRLYQVQSPNDYTENLEITDLKPGQKQRFQVTFQIYNFQYIGATSKPKVEVKVIEVDW